MKLKKIMLLYVMMFCFAISHAYQCPIIPKPHKVMQRKGTFEILPTAEIIRDDSQDGKMGGFLSRFISEHYGVKVQKASKNKGGYGFSFIIDTLFAEEEYLLDINLETIVIKGRESGLFYGLQSLLQLMPIDEDGSLLIPCIEIKDRPKFSYRGAMLDVGRYFYSVREVKRFIDLMAYYKLNTFHWHLTEGDGWRLEVEKYPLLTEVGAWRMGTYTAPAAREKLPTTYDKLPHGGFYTKKQIKDIIKYAEERHITIIPEIDVPGHSKAALDAYPFLSCDLNNNAGVLCLGSDNTYAFVKDVLDETMALFPSKIIHIGGDEANKEAWKKCSSCQKKMKEKGLKDEDELQSYFIREMATHIESNGRTMMGWDEIMEGGELTPNSMVMSWRGEEGGIKASAQQRFVVMSPADFLYLDYFQGPKEFEPVAFAKMLTLPTVYNYDPLANIPLENRKFIKGVQGNIWTQCIHSQEKLDYMTFPRMLALSEIGWSDSQKDYMEFYRRMGQNLPWLTKMGVNYRIPEPLGLQDQETKESSIEVELEPSIKGSIIYYSLDGEENLLRKGIRYDSPIRIDLTSVDSVTVKCIVRTPQGAMSGIRVATYKKID
ncbi:beta-N-acetylhexosaminidase [Sphingobacterium athyrii]|uniref:beta-N-acetylhexosaminidase n=1 Tax=Sphingobacterium athyrii TaxID=2152717 RepID=A0A363NZY6_9SPHI|nr:beta-N-acetylhexosaminidase [Sphingobacterium athyrii]